MQKLHNHWLAFSANKISKTRAGDTRARLTARS